MGEWRRMHNQLIGTVTVYVLRSLHGSKVGNKYRCVQPVMSGHNRVAYGMCWGESASQFGDKTLAYLGGSGGKYLPPHPPCTENFRY